MNKFILLLLVTFPAIGATVNTENEKSNLSARDIVIGVWGWNIKQCKNNPASISFKNDGSIMYFDTYKGMYLGDKSKPIKRVEYIITGENKNVLFTSIKGEDRLDKNGRPVSWQLVVKSRDTFCWRRNDWPKNGCTKNLIRCK